MRNFIFIGLMACLLSCGKECPECTTPAPLFKFNFVDESGENLIDPDHPEHLEVKKVSSTPGGEEYNVVIHNEWGVDILDWFISMDDSNFYSRSDRGEEFEVEFDNGEKRRIYVRSAWNSRPKDDCSCLVQEYEEVLYRGENYGALDDDAVFTFQFN